MERRLDVSTGTVDLEEVCIGAAIGDATFGWIGRGGPHEDLTGVLG